MAVLSACSTPPAVSFDPALDRDSNPNPVNTLVTEPLELALGDSFNINIIVRIKPYFKVSMISSDHFIVHKNCFTSRVIIAFNSNRSRHGRLLF